MLESNFGLRCRTINQPLATNSNDVIRFVVSGNSVGCIGFTLMPEGYASEIEKGDDSSLRFDKRSFSFCYRVQDV